MVDDTMLYNTFSTFGPITTTAKVSTPEFREPLSRRTFMLRAAETHLVHTDWLSEQLYLIHNFAGVIGILLCQKFTESETLVRL
jgi:hypothetical protein